jgi:hypothetical protein
MVARGLITTGTGTAVHEVNTRKTSYRVCSVEFLRMTIVEKRSQVRPPKAAVGLVRQSWGGISDLESTIANAVPASNDQKSYPV